MTSKILTGQDVNKIIFCPVMYNKFNIDTTKEDEDFELISKCVKYMAAEYILNNRIIFEKDFLNFCDKTLRPMYKKHKISKNNSLLISLVEWFRYFAEIILSKGYPVTLDVSTHLQYNKTAYIGACDMLVSENYSLLPIYIINGKQPNNKDINALLMCYAIEEHFKIQVKSYLRVYIDTTIAWNRAILHSRHDLYPGWQDRAEHYIKSLALTVENNIYYPNTSNCSVCNFNTRCKL